MNKKLLILSLGLALSLPSFASYHEGEGGTGGVPRWKSDPRGVSEEREPIKRPDRRGREHCSWVRESTQRTARGQDWRQTRTWRRSGPVDGPVEFVMYLHIMVWSMKKN